MGLDEDAERLLLKDVNAAIKQVLSEVEIAARMLPEASCHPYECERRRKVIIRTIWAVFRRARGGQDGTE